MAARRALAHVLEPRDLEAGELDPERGLDVDHEGYVLERVPVVDVVGSGLRADREFVVVEDVSEDLLQSVDGAHGRALLGSGQVEPSRDEPANHGGGSGRGRL